MTPERLEEIKRWADSLNAGIAKELITALEQAEAEVERLKATLDGDPSQMASPELRRAWRASAVRYADKVEAEHDKLEVVRDELLDRLKQAESERDKWMGQFGAIAYQHGYDLWHKRCKEVEADRDKWMGQFDEAEHRGLAYMEERDKLREDIANHFATEHLAGDGPEIDRWKAKCDKLAVELDQERQLRLYWKSKAEEIQSDNNKLAAKLKECEAYNENMAEEAAP